MPDGESARKAITEVTAVIALFVCARASALAMSSLTRPEGCVAAGGRSRLRLASLAVPVKLSGEMVLLERIELSTSSLPKQGMVWVKANNIIALSLERSAD